MRLADDCQSDIVAHQGLHLLIPEDPLCFTFMQIYEESGCQVHFTSALEQSGMEELRGFLKGKTTAVAGQRIDGASLFIANTSFYPLAPGTGIDSSHTAPG